MGVCRALGSRSWGVLGVPGACSCHIPFTTGRPSMLKCTREEKQQSRRGAPWVINGNTSSPVVICSLWELCGTAEMGAKKGLLRNPACFPPPRGCALRPDPQLQTETQPLLLLPGAWGWRRTHPRVRSPAAGAAGRGLPQARPRGLQHNAMNCINGRQPRGRRSGTLVSYGKQPFSACLQ